MRQSPKVPLERFFTGVGEAPTAAEAEARAREDLQERMLAGARAELLRRLSGGAPAHLRLARVDSAIELLRAAGPARVAEAWQARDGNRHAALVALDRAEQAAALGDQVLALSAELGDALRISRELSAAQPYAGVLHALGAFALLAQLEDARACQEVVQPGRPGDPPPAADEGALLARLGEALAAVEVFAPDQAAWRAGEEGRTALLLAGTRAAATGEPAAGVPLRFASAEAGLERAVRSDEAGLASVVLDLAGVAAPGARLALAVGLDGPTVLEEAGMEPRDPRWTPLLERLSAARATQALVRPAADGARVAVLVAELRSGKFQQDSRAAQALAEALAARGFRPRPAADLAFRLDGEPTPVRVASALAGQAELAVYGVVQTTLVPQRAGGLAFAEAQGELVAVRLPGGEVLGRYQGSAKGAGLGAGQAEGRAVEILARQAMEQLLPGLGAPP